MTQVLVTGGAGFIGSNLCKKLLGKGHNVIAIDNLITSNGKNLIQFSDNPKFTFVKHDITKPLPKNLTKRLPLQYIYHLACPTGVPNIKTLGKEMLLTSSVGTQNILELARRHGAKVLFTSSSEIYGNPQVFPQTENYTGNVDPIGPRSPYEEGKRFSETLVTIYVKKYSIDAKIVRVFNTYGPLMSDRDTRVIPNFLRQAIRNTPLTVQGDGTQKRTFCYIDDLVNGLLAVMRQSKKGEVYNLGSDQEVTILDLAKIIIKITDSKSKIIFIKRPPHDHNSRLPSLKKAKKLDWLPKIGLEDGLKRTLLWCGY